jgi:protein-tyrosine-phosphatase
MHGECADALEILFGHGYSAYNHISTRLSWKLLRDADVVVAVSEGHARYLRENYSEYAHKVVSFPKPVPSIVYLRDRSMQKAVEGIRDQIFEMFLEDSDEI